MSKLRPYSLFIATNIVILSALIVVFVIPFARSVIEQREELDTIRTNIESLRLEQSKIGSLSTTYAALQEYQQYIELLFLNDSSSIEFFNSLDKLETEQSLSNLAYSVDPPAKNVAQQVLGIHVSFSSTFQNAVSAVKKMYMLPVAFRITSITVSGSSEQNTVSVSIDGSISWSQS